MIMNLSEIRSVSNDQLLNDFKADSMNNDNLDMFKKDEKRNSLSIDFSQPQSIKKRLIRNGYLYGQTLNDFTLKTPDYILKSPDVLKCLLNTPQIEEYTKSLASLTPIQQSPLTPFKLFESLNDFRSSGNFLSPISDLFTNQVMMNSAIDQAIKTENKFNSPSTNCKLEKIDDNEKLNKKSKEQDSKDTNKEKSCDQKDTNLIIDESNLESNNNSINKINESSLSQNTQSNLIATTTNGIKSTTSNSLVNSTAAAANLFSNHPILQTTSYQPINHHASLANLSSSYLSNNLINCPPPRIIDYEHSQINAHSLANQYAIQSPNYALSNGYAINNQVNHYYNNHHLNFSDTLSRQPQSISNVLTDSNKLGSNQVNKHNSPDSRSKSTLIKKLKNDEPVNKNEEKRLRNREAATRCRQRKQAKVSFLEKRVNQLEVEKYNLIQKLNQIENDNLKLIHELNQMKGVQCSTVKQ